MCIHSATPALINISFFEKILRSLFRAFQTATTCAAASSSIRFIDFKIDRNHLSVSPKKHDNLELHFDYGRLLRGGRGRAPEGGVWRARPGGPDGGIGDPHRIRDDPRGLRRVQPLQQHLHDEVAGGARV